MIETTTPFAALAIAGMSFRGGADCTATTPARSKPKGRATEEKPMTAFFTPAFSSYQSLPGTALQSMVSVEAVISTRRSEASNADRRFTVVSTWAMAYRVATP
ncbi:MAG: hypothetical protein WA660_10150, partial [Candidatus Acidiferrales bacterium]